MPIMHNAYVEVYMKVKVVNNMHGKVNVQLVKVQAKLQNDADERRAGYVLLEL